MVDTPESVENPTRRSKVLEIEAAVALIPPESESLWVGGMHMHNVPMALVRECIRQGKRFETFFAGPSSSLAAELLMGAGLVKRVVVGYIGFEQLGLAPVFRRLAEQGSEIRFIEADPGSMLLALQAGMAGQQFAPLPPGLENTSLPGTSPDFYRQLVDPFTGKTSLAVQAIKPSVGLIHCQQADEFGNGIFKGSMFSDHLLALAAETVLMQVEGLVSNDQILRYPLQTGVPSMRVAAVVPVLFGCHPCSSHRYYNYDDVHLRLYMEAASSDEGFADYMKRFVFGPEDQEEYMRRVQNQDWSSIQ
ncbi:MAG TPA: CoA-transferase [Chloroflexia bacterium]|nr:CoA-transferase [Chloroflexia bacterium]